MKALLVAVVILASSASAVLDCSTPCTKTQCAKTQCVTTDPYACVAGTATGGCAGSASYFSNTSLCTDCCDISGCAITCGPCSAEECRAATCTLKTPFACTAGADKGGCATSGSVWKINPGCQSCCDTTQCPTMAPPPVPTVAPPVKLNCNKSCGDMCKTSATCSTNFPYMCIKGNETDGCKSEDKWDSPACEDCCDVRMCPTTPCGACSSSVCRNTKCSFQNPFICTSGKLAGGCSSQSSYWPGNSNCESCCDLEKCG